ncbi:hypothetical protein JKP88DRAFT_246088 [Tribonema minus]|uniref:Uncharacterized protein n=1 Tax=Tribonema minus TaxID=303371 RepID=A0A836CCV4_9STRA|nr:hypothetical protein JKP88DRAFT_246088 [Tribonema minus]
MWLVLRTQQFPLPLLLLLMAACALCASSDKLLTEIQRRKQQQLVQELSPQRPEHHTLSLSPTAAFAAAQIAVMHRLPPDQLFRNSLVHRGGITDLQLEIFFRKCVTAGSVINVGAIGGSNTQLPWSFLWPVVDMLQEMCPKTTVTGFNGARGSHGSLTLGMCVKTVTAPELDIAFAEFALNDEGQYRHQNGNTSSFPYELMTRTMLANYDPAPAVFSLFMWGRNFKFDSAQADLEPIVEYYNVTALSLRDLVWPYVMDEAEPWPSVARLTRDKNHAIASIQHYVARLFVLYICERFQEWAARISDGTFDPNAGLSPVVLPAPLNQALFLYDVETASFDCAIVGSPGLIFAPMPGRLPVMLATHGWQVFEDTQCIQVLDMTAASTLLPVHSTLGIVLFSNCYRPGYLDTTPAFRINLVEGDAEPYKRTPLQLVSAMQGDLDGNAEMYRVDPPLEPGARVLEAVPNSECTPKKDEQCDGFYTVITLLLRFVAESVGAGTAVVNNGRIDAALEPEMGGAAGISTKVGTSRLTKSTHFEQQRVAVADEWDMAPLVRRLVSCRPPRSEISMSEADADCAIAPSVACHHTSRRQGHGHCVPQCVLDYDHAQHGWIVLGMVEVKPGQCVLAHQPRQPYSALPPPELLQRLQQLGYYSPRNPTCTAPGS